MKKSAALLIILSVFAFSLSVFAETGFEKKNVVDQVNVLSVSEEESIEKEIADVREKYKFDLVIVTVNGLEGKSSMEYADDYYDFNGYGCGSGRDGALLLLSLGTEDGTGRQGWISTCGSGLKIIDDESISDIGEALSDILRDNDYFTACGTFVNMCSDRLLQNRITSWIIACVIGLALSLIIVFTMKLGMNTAIKKRAASDYIKNGSINITGSKDVYMYSTISKTKKTNNNNSHTSSSGSSHGGGGFKF